MRLDELGDFVAWIDAGPLDGETTRLLACVGAQRHDVDLAAPARSLSDLALAAGAALAGTVAARPWLQHNVDAIEADPAQLLHALDPLLCRVDARWAWHLVRTRGAAVGAGTFATMLAEVRGEIDRPVDERLEIARPAMRMVAAALSGQPFEFDRAWATRWDDARTLAIAALAIQDPEAALAELRARRTDCPIARVPGVVELAARGLVARGRRVELSSLPGDLGAATRACWLSELIAGEAIDPSSIAEALATAARAIDDNCDPGDEPRDGAPLLTAHLGLGHVDAAIALAARWRCPPPLFASLTFAYADAATARALLGADAIGRLAACPRDEWSARDGGWMTDWWLAAERAGEGFSACRAVLGVTTMRPWPSSMGSLVDLIDLGRIAAMET